MTLKYIITYTCKLNENYEIFRACREDYGDNAVEYVQVKKVNSEYVIKGKICPEHRVSKKSYTVTMIVDTTTETVSSVTCEDCPASQGKLNSTTVV